MFTPEELEKHYSCPAYDAIYCGLHEGKPLLFQRHKENCIIGYPSFLLCDPDDPLNDDKIKLIYDDSLKLFDLALKVMKERKINWPTLMDKPMWCLRIKVALFS